MSAPSGEDMGEELTLDAAAQVERALIHLFIKMYQWKRGTLSITTGAGRALHTRPAHLDTYPTARGALLHRHVENEPGDDADDDAADAALHPVLHEEHHRVEELEGEPEPVKEARSDRHL